MKFSIGNVLGLIFDENRIFPSSFYYYYYYFFFRHILWEQLLQDGTSYIHET